MSCPSGGAAAFRVDRGCSNVEYMPIHSWKLKLDLIYIYDNGGEFNGHKFQSMLANAGITHVKTTVKNPQSNAVCERMHATMGSMLRTITNSTDAPTNIKEAEQAVDNALYSCIHALRCSINQAM